MENSEVIILPELSMFFSTMLSQAGDGQSALLPCLHAAQVFYGYIPEKVIEEIAADLQIPIGAISDVIDFYPLFHRKPVNKTIFHVCNDLACKMAGADTVFRTFRGQENEIGKLEDLPTIKSPCLGICAHTPSDFEEAGMLRIPVANKFLHPGESMGIHTKTVIMGDLRLVTRRCGSEKSVGLMEYWGSEGYQALKQAFSLSSDEVIATIKSSGLTGRGGEAFLTGIKWEKTAITNQKTRYIICNAAEADPSSYKDRVLLEDDPHSVLEGMIIAAYAVKASQGYLYLNGEFDAAYQALSRAIIDAREAGVLGKNIMGKKFDFGIELRQGGGRYTCGEETALLESIEGKCGIPRKKPPFPTSKGLFGKPTVINNVETFCNIPIILRMGAREFRNIGTETSKGTILLCLVGDILRPGLIEIPFGLTFQQIIFEICGGLLNNQSFQAAIVGGVTGSFLSEKDLDIPISHEKLKKKGISLGPGSIVVLDNTRNIRDVLIRVSKFLADESCGICPSCVEGTRRQYEILNKAPLSKISTDDLHYFRELLPAMEKSSICRIGKAASSLAKSAYQKWPSQFS
jgi:NADH-quinone oxidoreductase subunit F